MPNSQNWHFTVQTTPENEDEFLLHLSLVSEDLGSRTLLLEEKSLPQQDKPIYNALLDVMHDSPLPVCKRCCHRAIWNVREDLRNKASVTAVKTEIMSSLATFLIVTKGVEEPIGKDSVIGLDISMPNLPTGKSLNSSLPSLDGTQSLAAGSLLSFASPLPFGKENFAPGKQPCMLACKKMLMIGQLNSSSTETEDSESLGSADTWSDESMESKSSDQESGRPRHCVEINTHVFLFNVPRGSMQFLNYGLLENLKDRMVLSPKYDSKMKILRKTPHVIVFCNEDPDMDKMSADRYIINALS